ncbi:pseudaminic acid synthase [Thalassospira lucentensis]|uniref:pseudaminic acid synthase n=1 Tax=Thalassospira lucentensis TaxID=168935 RepID=UPI0003B6F815|nr:pseudaminic acid synthase [Thalassospira lucentensis]RCK30555.1 N-acetylneuraminate synthase [Thalassospira lucentensis MCCC 1A00383 = DSM 14000]
MSTLKRPFIIAEVSGNHNGSIERAKEIISSAATNGASCVKLQTYTADTMTIRSDKPDFQIKGGLWDGRNLYELYEWAQTPYEWQKPLFDHARSLGIECISTPFDETAVDLLVDIGCPKIKIASFEVTDLPLIKYIAETKKPVIMSTGMANKQEISDALELLHKYGNGEVMLLHCVSGYPTPAEQMNLNAIGVLKSEFGCSVGLSDHTLGNQAAIAAVALGAEVIEKHFTLRRADGGPDAAFSMEPEELAALVRDCKTVYDALGNGAFDLVAAEQENVKFRRSIYAVKSIKAGEAFSQDNIRRIRPGFGLEPKYFDLVLGKLALRDFSAGDPLTKADL